MQFAFDLYHQAIIYVGPTLCVCVHQCVLQYDADCHAMSQDIIMTVWHCEEWSPALHPPPPPRQNSFISSCRLVWKSLAWESAQIPGGSQQRGTLMWHLTAYLCSFFFFFSFHVFASFPSFFCFTAECKNAIIVAVSGRGRQFGRGERRCCLRHVYRELCQMTMGKGRETRTESREWQDVGGGARE